MIFKNADISFSAQDTPWASILRDVDSLSLTPVVDNKSLYIATSESLSASAVNSAEIDCEVHTDNEVSITLQRTSYNDCEIYSSHSPSVSINDITGVFFYYISSSDLNPIIQTTNQELDIVISADLQINTTYSSYIESELEVSENLQVNLLGHIDEKYMILSKYIRPKAIKSNAVILLSDSDQLDISFSDYVETNIPIVTVGNLAMSFTTDVSTDAEIGSGEFITPSVSLSFLEKTMNQSLVLLPTVEENNILNYLSSSQEMFPSLMDDTSFFTIQPTALKVFDGVDWVEKTNPVFIKQSNGSWDQVVLKTKQTDGSWA